MLHKIRLKPGMDKQSSDTGAEGKWVNGDYTRFRYGFPEKIGGWSQLVTDIMVGAGRDQHTWTDIAGNKYAAIGTNKILYIYYEGALYDITPLDTARQQTSATFITTNSSTEVTITTATDHGADVGDIILFESATLPATSAYSTTLFNNRLYEIKTVPSATTFTIEMASAETGAGSATAGGSVTVDFYYIVGPLTQGLGYGWGTNTFGGYTTPLITTTLNNGGVLAVGATSATFTSTISFPTTADGGGTILIDSELIAYTDNDTATGVLSGFSRAQGGTSDVEHTDGTLTYDATTFVGWGNASPQSNVVIEPGQWRLTNYGENLLALINNNRVFQWVPSPSNLTVRATAVTGTQIPTTSRDMVISTPDRHIVLIGTETTVQDSTTQDDMFVRWSNQEETTVWTPTATNTAGSQRLTDGSKLIGALVGKTAVYIWSDTAMYTMKFIGPPLTFGFQQVGTNCGLSSQHAMCEVNGIAYWMGPTGFYSFNGGQVQLLPCLVEDYVYNDINTGANQQIHIGVNASFGEITWFYPSEGSDEVDRSVTYNYMESSPDNPIWYTSSLARQTWTIEGVYPRPYASEFRSGITPDTPTIQGVSNGGSYYWQQEFGTDESFLDGSSVAIAANIESGDYDIGQQGIEGPIGGEFMMRISRIIPDFGAQTGDAKVYLNTKAFPTSSAISTSYNSTTSTTQIFTRQRARQIALKIGNISTGQSWRMGTFRLDIHAGGRR
jgi:hypothetical protein